MTPEEYHELVADHACTCGLTFTSDAEQDHHAAIEGRVWKYELLNPELSDPDADDYGMYSPTGPTTSQLAAWRKLPTSGTDRRVVLDAYIAVDKGPEDCDGGWTDDELILYLSSIDPRWNYSNIGPRRRELMHGNWVIETVYRRLTSSDRDAVVWMLTDRARRELSLPPTSPT